MFKKTLIVALFAVGGCLATAPSADAGIFFRGGPVRRVAARTVLPPYPVARAVVPGPVYRPVVGYGVGYGAAYSTYYAPAPVLYGPSIGVVVY